MSFGSSLDTKEQVRQAIDVVDLVGRYVQLRRRGRLYLGLCPWHDDTRPSLQVNPERQTFKCWVCDIGGDIFSFVMKMEGVSFPEALAMLADQAGIALEPFRPTRAGPPGTAASMDGEGPAAPGDTDLSPEGKRALYRAMAWAETQYHECLLHAPEAEPARQYLAKRGITAQSIARFHLGFSPNEPDWILQRARGTRSRAKVLETIGLLARSVDGRMYDRFRGRLLFPIRDTQDRPIALGGRILPESGTTSRAKYINSPETPLFTKSNHLYGLDLAREALRKSRTALVMEGYTDCIVAHQHGFEDAVAVLGTALTDRHVRVLKRFVDQIVLVLDGDEAGQRRANEVLALFLAENVDLRILTLPEGTDPADFLEEHGAEAFRDLLATRALDALEHAFEAKTQGVDLEGDIHGASRAMEEMLSILATAPRLRHDTTHEHRLREEKTLARLAFKFRVPEPVVRDRLTALRRAAKRRGGGGEVAAPSPDESAGPPMPAPSIDPWQLELLEILIRHPELVAGAQAAIPSDRLASGPARRVFETCCRLSEAGQTPTFDRLMLELDDPAVKTLLVKLDEQGAAKEQEATEPEALLRAVIKSFEEGEAVKQRPVDEGSLRERRLAHEQELDLLRRIVEQERARQGISDPTDG